MLFSELISKLKSTNSRLDKEATLRETFLGDPDAIPLMNQDLLTIIQLTLNPFKQFYTRKIPDHTPNDNVQTDYRSMFVLLERLSQRTVTGHKARDEIQSFLNQNNSETAFSFKTIIDKDLKCGVGTTTINKIIPGSIPEFNCALASSFEEKRADYPCAIEPKIDGLRVLAFCENGTVTYMSRGGKEFTTLDSLTEYLLLFTKGESWVVDGEITSGEDFQTSVSMVKRKTSQTEDYVFHIFDMVSVEDFKNQKNNIPYLERRVMVLEYQIEECHKNLVINPSILVHSSEEIMEYYKKFMDQKFEGAIVKNLNAPYEFDRSNNWMKVKPFDNVDVEITGFLEGSGKNVGRLGALVVDFEGLRCQVGGGFTDEQRIEFWNNQNEMIGQIIEVEYMERTKDGAMRHPRFIKLRSYKGEKS